MKSKSSSIKGKCGHRPQTKSNEKFTLSLHQYKNISEIIFTSPYAIFYFSVYFGHHFLEFLMHKRGLEAAGYIHKNRIVLFIYMYVCMNLVIALFNYLFIM